MEKTFKKGGTAHIRALIEEGIRSGSRTATVTGDWEIAEAVSLPSDFTLILENYPDGCLALR